MTWDQLLPLIPAGLVPAALLFWAQHLGYWSGSREVTLLKDQIVAEQARTQFWIVKFERVQAYSETRDKVLEDAVDVLRDTNGNLKDALQALKQVTR